MYTLYGRDGLTAFGDHLVPTLFENGVKKQDPEKG